MAENPKKRLFIALNLPEKIKDEIEDLVVKLKDEISEVKWCSRKNLHLTLHFLGYLSQKQIEQVELIMQSQAGRFGTLNFKLGKLGGFPGPTQARIVFIELNQSASKSVFKLQEILGGKLKEMGVKVDDRSWKPHITLARSKNRNISLKQDRIKDIEIFSEEFPVATFELMESKLLSEGPIYNKVASYNL